MHASSVFHGSLRQGSNGWFHRQTKAGTKTGRSIQLEDAVATVSLAVLSTTVVSLVYQSIVP
jgi:hypothetical protein